MTNHQDTITKICELRGHEGFSEKYCMHVYLNYFLPDKLYRSDRLAILGFLCQKETLISCFGETCEALFHDIPCSKRARCSKCGKGYNGKPIGSKYVAWQYHSNQQAGFTAEERLEYIEKYWKEKE